jgi:hypothetical protein
MLLRCWEGAVSGSAGGILPYGLSRARFRRDHPGQHEAGHRKPVPRLAGVDQNFDSMLMNFALAEPRPVRLS